MNFLFRPFVIGWTTLILIFFVAVSAVSARPVETVTLSIDGTPRSFRYTAPDKTGALPVILSFHGFGGSAAQQEEMSGLTPLARRAGMIIVYPQGRKARGGKRYWATQARQDQAGELAFVRAILDYLKSHHSVDTRRVFATGISNGGGMAHMVAAHMSRQIAAIAPVSGAYYDYRATRPKTAVPVLAFHGAKDRLVPINGRGQLPDIHDWAGYWARQNGCSAQPLTQSSTPVAKRERWGQCAAPVTLVTLVQGRHNWPGNARRPSGHPTVDASQEIIKFFASR